MKISACLIVKNEEKVIERCLKSLDFVEEIIVVDSGSNDKTVEIAKKYTDKVYFQEWLGYDKQRNFAASKAKNDWIFVLDADEVATKELSEEIINLKNIEKHDIYLIARQNYFINYRMKYSGAKNDFQIKLYNRRKCYWKSIVHEKLEGSKNIGKLKKKLNHFAFDSEQDILFKINKYTTLEAIKMLNEKKSNIIKILFYPSLVFIYKYIFQLGFLDGRVGYLWALSRAYYHRMKFFKYSILLKETKRRK